MRLVPVPIEEIITTSWRRSHCKVIKSIDAFLDSGMPAVELQWSEGEYASGASVQSTYSKAIRANKYNAVIMTRKGKVYLIRGDVLNEHKYQISED